MWSMILVDHWAAACVGTHPMMDVPHVSNTYRFIPTLIASRLPDKTRGRTNAALQRRTAMAAQGQYNPYGLEELQAFGIRRVQTVIYQSGVGSPGVPAWDILGNVVPSGADEEESIESEAGKLLGEWDADHCF